MLDYKFVLANLDAVRKSLEEKHAANEHTRLDLLPELEERRKKAILEVEALKQDKNKTSKDIGMRMGRLKSGKVTGADLDALNAEINALKARSEASDGRIAELEQEQKTVEAQRDEILSWIPNVPHASVPHGATPEENVTERTWGEPRKYDFALKQHFELGAKLGILDTARGGKVSGSGWYFLRADGARMERALISWFLDTHRVRNGYTELFPPFMVSQKTLFGCGQYPKFKEQMYHAQIDDLYAIATAEVPVTSFHADEVLDEEELPKKYAAYSACFRREAGAAGSDTRGILRVHQFNKVEMLKLTLPEKSYEEHAAMLENAEYLLQELGLQYRVLSLCRGDLSFSAAKCWDLEAYAPATGKWLEVSSVSNFEDFQARRANIRYKPKDGGKPQFVHTINGSGLALPRIMVALWESNQQPDGTIVIPQVLRKYMDGQEIIK